MPLIDTKQAPDTEIVAIMLMGGRVTRGFRESVFAHASKLGLSVNEFALLACAEKVHRAGLDFPGIFTPGDFANIPHSTARTDHV